MAVKVRSQSAAIGVSVAEAGNYWGEALVAQGQLPYAEMTRQGQGWSTMSVTALAALVTRPTTTAGFEIRNNYAAAGKCLVIDRIFCEWRLATAVASSAVMYYMVGPQAAITAGAFTIRGHSGKAYGGEVTCAISQAVADLGWFPVGNSITAALAAATPNGGQDSRIEGRIVVQPGHALSLHVVASVTGDTFIQGASWYEVDFGAGEIM